MMGFVSLLIFISLPSVLVTAAEPGSGHWCYESIQADGCPGPSKWTDEFKDCGGHKQSPINIDTKNVASDSNLKSFAFKGYDSSISTTIKNNGHSAEVALTAAITISDGGLENTYTAAQLHFHWGSSNSKGSEHTIDGKQYAMELHIVHALQDGSKAVLGFLYEESEHNNEKYDNLITAVKGISNINSNQSIANLKLQDLIPEEKDLTRYYRYEGSLTTPPCTENVIWTVFEEPILLGKEQIKAFYETLNFDAGTHKMENNFRPVQNLNERKVSYSRAGAILSLGKPLLISLAAVCLMITF
ncbi:carbonic anhydrase 4 [Bombina bombina]|uniref:carbonic anhydrase 4 n=1 Tax=Bombina bombina TaxID=8345 RepID=UPI00235A48A6|nr:carbonic anhydrase 4 [Bombina bombina]